MRKIAFTLKLFNYYLNFNETSNPFLFNAVYSVYQFITVSKTEKNTWCLGYTMKLLFPFKDM